MYANIISVMFSLGFFFSGEQSKDSNKPECATIMMVRCDCFCFQFETQRKKRMVQVLLINIEELFISWQVQII